MNATTNTSKERTLRALVLDADASAAGLLGHALEARGFSVELAGDGTTGVAKLLDGLLELDALVVDLDLPHRDARGFADLVRRAGGERDLPIVVLAAVATPELRAELLTLGVDAVLDRGSGADAIVAGALAAIAARASSRADEAPSRAAVVPAAFAARWSMSVTRLALLPA